MMHSYRSASSLSPSSLFRGTFGATVFTGSSLGGHPLYLYCWSKLIHTLCMRLWIT